MRLTRLLSRGQLGIEAPAVEVEVHLSGGLPAFQIVGLAEAAVRESRDRVRAAIQNAGFQFPVQRITVNLAPADLPKHGGRYDLPIAIGILVASGQLRMAGLDLEQMEFAAELALDGKLRGARAILPVAVAAARCQRHLILAADDAQQAALAGGECHGFGHLLDVCAALSGRDALQTATAVAPRQCNGYPCLSDLHGQHQARRALEVAAAGRHNLLFCGPPGAGKSMLAERLPGLLPALDQDEALEAGLIRSLCEDGDEILRNWHRAPFRHPHHSASAAALIGGGAGVISNN